jgi:hypothetical protein
MDAEVSSSQAMLGGKTSEGAKDVRNVLEKLKLELAAEKARALQKDAKLRVVQAELESLKGQITRLSSSKQGQYLIPRIQTVSTDINTVVEDISSGKHVLEAVIRACSPDVAHVPLPLLVPLLTHLQGLIAGGNRGQHASPRIYALSSLALQQIMKVRPSVSLALKGVLDFTHMVGRADEFRDVRGGSLEMLVAPVSPEVCTIILH